MFDVLEKSLYWLNSVWGQSDAAKICQIRAAINEHTLVSDDNSLITFFRVIGSRRHIGTKEYLQQSAGLASTLTGLLKSGEGGKQHSFAFGFRSNPSGGKRLIQKILKPGLTTAQRLGADAGFLFSDKLEAMQQYCVEEIAVFVVMTHTQGLSRNEKERWSQVREKQFAQLGKDKIVIDADITQSPMGPPGVLLSRHNAAIETAMERISSEGSGAKVMLEKLTVHQACSVMRRFLDASLENDDWRPELLGDRPLGVNAKRTNLSLELALPMRVGRQLVTERLIEHFGDAEVVKRGAYWYASITLDVGPQEENFQTFAEFCASIGMMPWQMHLDMTPNGLGRNSMNKIFASFFGSAGDHNRAIKRGYDDLQARSEEGDYISAIRVVFTTWAKSEQDCVNNLSVLRTSVDAWGQTTTTNETGAPAHAYLSSAPAFSSLIPAKFIAAPLSTSVRMTPMFRSSSIWQTGQLVPFTKEGLPYPIYLGSPQQNYWGTLVFAPTGSGKSFMMNMLNAGILFSPGMSTLPMVTVIDKGPSAKGLVMLAQAMLPPELLGEIAYWRPTPNDVTYRVNPFDTQLGCDKPTASDKDFLSALLGGMAPNLGPESGKFLGRVIDAAYEMFERSAPTAVRWNWTFDEEISQKLKSLGIEYRDDQAPRVWTVVDRLFESGFIDLAQRAQYFAVPTMDRITKVLQERTVLNTWESATLPNGESIVKVFERNILGAASSYQVFFGTTKHTATARFKVIDIEGMAAASTSEEGRRRFGLMMLFARRLGARDFFLHPDDIAAICPKLYLNYQMQRVKKIQEQLKFLEYDEIHNAKGIGEVQALLQKDAREGRKYNVVGILSSQELEDFPPELVNNSYNFFILGSSNTGASMKALQSTFALSDSECAVIQNECRAPGRMFCIFRTNQGTLSQFLVTRPGQREKWAYSTTASDMALRDTLYKQLGCKDALRVLADLFPTGSAKNFIDKLKANASLSMNDDAITDIAIEQLRPEIEKRLQKN